MFMTLGMAEPDHRYLRRDAHPARDAPARTLGEGAKDGITDVELAHFEGELQASHELREGSACWSVGTASPMHWPGS